MRDRKVTPLPVRAKPRPDEVAVKLVDAYERKCQHEFAGFTVDESANEITCRGCGEKLNPVWAMAVLAREESIWRRQRIAYIEERKTLDAKRRTKCTHCGQFTRVRLL